MRNIPSDWVCSEWPGVMIRCTEPRMFWGSIGLGVICMIALLVYIYWRRE